MIDSRNTLSENLPITFSLVLICIFLYSSSDNENTLAIFVANSSAALAR